MFTAIAPRYDLLNRLLSGGRDRYWRRMAVDGLSPEAGGRYLDLATGTADVALEIAGRHPGKVKVVGVDFSHKMLLLGKRKILAENLQQAIDLQTGSAEHLAFSDFSFHGVISAFGVRNFADIERGLQEMWRVLKSGGRIVILEFSMPGHPVFKRIYRFYFESLLPRLGALVSGHNRAYSYLPESVNRFPDPGGFVSILERAGFRNVHSRGLTCGIVTVYTGWKHV